MFAFRPDEKGIKTLIAVAVVHAGANGVKSSIAGCYMNLLGFIQALFWLAFAAIIIAGIAGVGK
jgi:hypothetical protein